MSFAESISQILEENPSLEIITDINKVKCCLSGHEMPCKVEAITSYLNGKKYKALKSKHDYNFEQYKTHLVKSDKKGHGHQLFCKLTLRHVNYRPVEIARHVQGRRFQRAIKIWEECQRTGEVFKPRGGQQKPAELADSDAEDDGEFEDDMSDLLPADAFDNETSETEQAESYDLEELKIAQPDEPVANTSCKRSAPHQAGDGQQNGGSSKKRKTKHKRKAPKERTTQKS